MKFVQIDIIDWIGSKTVALEQLYVFIRMKLAERYQIGGACVRINNIVTEKLLFKYYNH